MKFQRTFCFLKLKPVILILTLISCSITLWTDGSAASQDNGPGSPSGLVPASLIKWPAKASEYAILVDKSAQKVFVYHRDNLFTPVRVFVTSTGENEGPKVKENDRKTPEGIYFFTDSFVRRELAPIYGSRAFPIDYPNPMDKKQGLSGYGIWFHGTNKPLKPTDTNGCIALNNPDIDELANYIRLRDTPTIISPKIEMVEAKKLQKEAEELDDFVESWRRHWEGKEIDAYMSHYSPRFTAGSRNWESWKNHKKRLAKKYKKIGVEIENLQLIKNNGTVLARFDQRYRTAFFESFGEKRLYLERGGNQWKIVGEFFQDKKKAPPRPRKAPTPSLDRIKGLLDSWERAWEEKDLKRYIAFYDSNFRSRGMNLGAWYRHKERMNRKYRSIKIEIIDLKVVPISRSRVKVRFLQEYQADNYHDFGSKEILFIKKEKHWKIKREEWNLLRRETRP